jgi:hypothetical protein
MGAIFVVFSETIRGIAEGIGLRPVQNLKPRGWEEPVDIESAIELMGQSWGEKRQNIILPRLIRLFDGRPVTFARIDAAPSRRITPAAGELDACSAKTYAPPAP